MELRGCQTRRCRRADGTRRILRRVAHIPRVYNKLKKREERPLRGEVAYKMGLCYRKLNMSARASAAFQNALRYSYPDSLTHLYLAQSLQSEGRYRDAINAYQDYLATEPRDAAVAETGIAGCRKRDGSESLPTRYVVKQAKLFSSRRADFSPMFAGDDHDVLYFTTTNEKVTGSNRSEITGMKKGDIWVARKNEQGQWQRPEAVEGAKYRARRRDNIILARWLHNVPDARAPRAQRPYRRRDIHLSARRCQMECPGKI